MKAVVDPDICIGCGLCADTCPGVYRMEGDKAVISLEPVPPDQEECARKGAEECPVEAIKIL
ncbi:MAG: ferredoxin [Omnitrophica WOR_2 bacterium RIFCSPHIGHO2_02_FULL_45_21]|nr:MAG: ferredoxin [Omnitrophica WOR_2 bacterium RIFCSPHIGHO2_02_FULL_45_21]